MDIKLLSIKTTNCLTAVCLSTPTCAAAIYYLNNDENSLTFDKTHEINSTSYKSKCEENGLLIRNIYDS
jgi:hypothetical protein